MKLEFTIEEEDFLNMYLFNASQSKRIKKRKKTQWIIPVVASFIASIYFYLTENSSLSIYLAILGFIFLFFYPIYIKFLYKRHYKKLTY